MSNSKKLFQKSCVLFKILGQVAECVCILKSQLSMRGYFSGYENNKVMTDLGMIQYDTNLILHYCSIQFTNCSTMTILEGFPQISLWLFWLLILWFQLLHLVGLNSIIGHLGRQNYFLLFLI